MISNLDATWDIVSQVDHIHTEGMHQLVLAFYDHLVLIKIDILRDSFLVGHEPGIIRNSLGIDFQDGRFPFVDGAGGQSQDSESHLITGIIQHEDPKTKFRSLVSIQASGPYLTLQWIGKPEPLLAIYT